MSEILFLIILLFLFFLQNFLAREKLQSKKENFLKKSLILEENCSLCDSLNLKEQMPRAIVDEASTEVLAHTALEEGIPAKSRLPVLPSRAKKAVSHLSSSRNMIIYQSILNPPKGL